MQLPLKIAELDHVVLRCRDLGGTVQFYTAILGLKEERRIDRIGMVQLRAGASMIDLVASDEAPDPDARNVDHICLGVETADFAAMVEFLRGSAVEVIGEPAMRYGARGMGRSIYIRDPEGNVVELKEKPVEA